MRISMNDLVDGIENESFTSGGFRSILDLQFSQVFQSLILANNPEEYRLHAKNIREMVRRDTSSDFVCSNPHWFEESESEAQRNKIDSTVCKFCGYNGQCKTEEADFHVDILQIHSSSADDYRQLSNIQGAIKKSFKFDNEQLGMPHSDPFSGFSRKAGESRPLYVIRTLHATLDLPDDLSHIDLRGAIAYDLKHQQPIWSLDARTIRHFDNPLMSKNIREKIEEIIFDEKLKLKISDRRLLRSVAEHRQWPSAKDKELFGKLESEFANLLHSLETIPIFESLAIAPSTPLIDHPFSLHGAGGLHVALRLFDNVPALKSLFRKNKNFNILDKHFHLPTEITLDSVQSLGEGIKSGKRFIPRFPAILFVSPDFERQPLEFPAFRIIDVISSHVREPFLMFDNLDFDLSAIQRWDIA